MKIELKIGKDCNDSPIHDFSIDDKSMYYIRDLSDCPEDAHIGRDLIDGNNLIKVMKMAYEAGKKGEEMEIVYSELDE